MKKLLGLLAMAPMAVAACGGSAAVEGDINVYTRDTTSGTREGFFANIEAGDAKRDNAYLIQGVSEVSGNSDMIAKVTNDVNGIGYISLTSLDAAVGVKGLDFNGVEATEANVSGGTYGMSRDFSYTTIDSSALSDQTEKLVAEWHKFLASTEGVDLLQAAGVIVADSVTPYAPDASVCGGDVTNIQIGGSTSVEKAASALSTGLKGACAAFNGVHAHTGSSASEQVGKADADTLMHIGFSSSGKRTGWVSTNQSGDLGKDAIVAIVNKDNDKVSDLTTRQLQEVFVRAGATHDGEYVATNPTNTTFWKDLA